VITCTHSDHVITPCTGQPATCATNVPADRPRGASEPSTQGIRLSVKHGRYDHGACSRRVLLGQADDAEGIAMGDHSEVEIQYLSQGAEPEGRWLRKARSGDKSATATSVLPVRT
jgi:hypothetical protein